MFVTDERTQAEPFHTGTSPETMPAGLSAWLLKAVWIEATMLLSPTPVGRSAFTSYVAIESGVVTGPVASVAMSYSYAALK